MTQSANAEMLTIGTTPEESANTKARDREIVYDTQVYYDQFAFQKKYASGYVVNIGANSDGAGFRSRGGVNVDIAERDAYTGQLLPIDVFADARKLPWTEPTFDCAVLGEILEHMETPGAICALMEAARITKLGGKVVITLPHDDRGAPEDKQLMYAEGVFAYHHRKIERGELLQWIRWARKRADSDSHGPRLYGQARTICLEPLLIADIAYPWGCTGTGVVAEVKEEII